MRFSHTITQQFSLCHEALLLFGLFLNLIQAREQMRTKRALLRKISALKVVSVLVRQ